MNFRIEGAVTVIAVLLISGFVSAHHSLADFDTTKTVTITGTLTKVDWRNPHIGLALEANSDRGGVEAWVLAGAPPFYFRERDIGKERFQESVGKIVTIELHRAKNGTLRGVVLKVTFPDGTFVRVVPTA